MKVKDVPISERPYEKLALYGAETLSNSELLAIIIKTGNKEESAIAIAQKVLKLKNISEKKDLRFLQDISISEFMSIKGIGKVKAIQLKALCELTRRIGKPIDNKKIVIKTPEDIANLLMPELRMEKREHVKVMMLNTKNVVLKIADITHGGTSFAVVEPKDILLEPIRLQAPKIVLVHNHPSGDPTPSKEDYSMTDRIYDSAELMGIQLLDHIVIGDGKFESIFYNKKYK